MQGCGNDYVYIDLFKEKIDTDFSQLAKQLSNRNFGIGSDGLILIKPWQDGDAEMVMYNSDGSMSEMCGNGLRCVAKHVHDHYTQGKKELTLMTGAGIKTATIHTNKDGDAELISIDMGTPIFDGLSIPTTVDKPEIIQQILMAGGHQFTFSALSMGNPHCVIFVEDIENFPVENFGSLIERHKMFPNRTNVEFVEVVNESELIQRTWERGAGETLACGTGASAVAVISHILGHTTENITIHLRGGDLQFHYKKNGSVTMTGPAKEVFRGQLDINSINI